MIKCYLLSNKNKILNQNNNNRQAGLFLLGGVFCCFILGIVVKFYLNNRNFDYDEAADGNKTKKRIAPTQKFGGQCLEEIRLYEKSVCYKARHSNGIQ